MLGHLFLFHGRIGRLRYLLWAFVFLQLIFLLLGAVVCFMLAFGPAFLMTWPVYTVALALTVGVFVWMQTSLGAARMRDMGWKPGILIPLTYAISFLDFGVAYAFPGLADDTGFHMIVPEAIGFVMLFLMLVLPAKGEEPVPFVVPGLSLPRLSLDVFRRKPPSLPVNRKPRQPPLEERRLAYPREKVPFGRRGLT